MEIRESHEGRGEAGGEGRGEERGEREIGSVKGERGLVSLVEEVE